MKLPALDHLKAGALLLLLGGVAFYVWKRGSVASAAAGVGAVAVDAVGGVVSGAVGQVGASVGLPTPDETTADPAVARYIMDHPAGGYFEASKWAGAVAFGQALTMSASQGKAPPAGSPLYTLFPPFTGGASGSW